MPRRLVLALVAVAFAASIACSSSTSTTATTTSITTSTPTTASTTSPAPGDFQPEPAAFNSCGGRLQCATVRVPLDYADPSGRTIEVSINRRPARDESQRIGALLVNPGGPGGSGLRFVAAGLSLPDEVLDRFDLIGFDPRGVGASTGLPCGDSTVPPFLEVDSGPDSPEEQAELDAAAKAIADDCQQAAGDLLPFIGTEDVVRDMDTIRKALGEEQLNYLGISYGTLLGLRYAQLFPDRIRSMILDGVVDPTQDFRSFLRQQTIAFDEEINELLTNGDATAGYDEVARRVETERLPADNGRSVGPSELVTAALFPTYSPSSTQQFYEAIDSALEGDGRPLLRLADAYEGSVKFTAYVGVECVDSPHPTGGAEYKAFADELRAISPRFGAGIANELLSCAFWPAPVKSIVGPVTAPGSPPILVVGNTRDAATPYEQAVAVASTLSNGHLLTLDSDGHAAYGRSSCIAAREARYLVDLALPGEGTTCQG